MWRDRRSWMEGVCGGIEGAGWRECVEGQKELDGGSVWRDRRSWVEGVCGGIEGAGWRECVEG